MVKAMDKTAMTLREFWKNYNIYSAIKNIDASWHDVTRSCVNGEWKELCPYFVEDFTDWKNSRAAEGCKQFIIYELEAGAESRGAELHRLLSCPCQGTD